MDTKSSSVHRFPNSRIPRYRRDRGKKTWGLVILGIGLFLLLREFQLFDLRWKEIWPYLLIVIGLAIGIRNRFQKHAWWILCFIGIAHIIPAFQIGNISSSSLVVPLAFIIGGCMILFRSRGSGRCGPNFHVVSHDEQKMNVDVHFGGRKEIITSKDFRGGKVNVSF